MLPGHDHDARLIHQLPSRFLTGDVAVPNEPGWCAGGPRELLDLSASYEEARELATSAWRCWHQLAAELPAPLPSHVFHDRHHADRFGYPWALASADYEAQPVVRGYLDHLRTLPLERYRSKFLRTAEPVVHVGGHDEEHFVDQAARWALPRRNVLTLEGWWYEDGASGLHGNCDTPADCPHEPPFPAGDDHVNGYLAGLPGDTLLVNVHCHV